MLSPHVRTLHNKEKICEVSVCSSFFPPSISMSLHGSDMALRLDCSQAIRFWRCNSGVKAPNKSEI